MIEGIKAKIKREQKQNWRDFKGWIKSEYPSMLDMVKKYDKKSKIPCIIVFYLREFLREEKLIEAEE